MTENEAILKIKYRIDTATQVVGIGVDGKAYEDLEIAIQALEEIQQYRAIGTVEELKTAMKYVSLAKKHGTVGKAIDSCAEYEAIGTVEEFQHFITAWDELKILIDIAKNELSQYKSIGTVEEFKALKEKNVAKKPKMIGYRKDGEPVYECGCCGNTLKVADQPFCMICSCKIDWQ